LKADAGHYDAEWVLDDLRQLAHRLQIFVQAPLHSLDQLLVLSPVLSIVEEFGLTTGAQRHYFSGFPTGPATKR